jgi:flagellin
MGLQINSNIPGLLAGNETRRSSSLLGQTLKQLASGRRINSAADDAAGLAIAEQFNAQARQELQEINNLQSGVNVGQTADAALGVQQEAVQRLRELSIQASNGTLSDQNREALNAEAQQLIAQIDDIAQDTQFNGQNLLDENTALDLGTTGDLEVNINASTAADLGVEGIDLSTAAGAAAGLEAADSALTEVGQNRSGVGAQLNRFETAIEQRETSALNAQESESRIRDLDIARASIEQTQNQILLQGGLAAITQSNVTPQQAVLLLGS